MRKAKDEKINKLLSDLSLIDHQKFEILSEVREIIFSVHPKTEEKMMYGGIVFFLDKEMYSGVFASKNHVSIEFSEGFLMNDPQQLLEGTGKYRRHLKIKSKDDIEAKEVAAFVKQAVEHD